MKPYLENILFFGSAFMAAAALCLALYFFALPRHAVPLVHSEMNRAAGQPRRCTVKPAMVAGEERGRDE